MRTRGMVSLAIIVILLTSLIPVEFNSELEPQKTKSFANSEPEFLIQAGTSTAHVNGTSIGALPDGWVVSGNTKSSLNFGSSIQAQATSQYNTILEADTYVAAMDEQGNWLWAVMPDASQGLTLLQTMEVSDTGDIYIGGLIFGTVAFGSSSSSSILTAQNSGGDGFVAKLDPSGQWLWATSFNTVNGSGNFSTVSGLAETLSGSVIVSGSHKGETDFGGVVEVSADNEMFLVDLDLHSGTTNWASTAGGIGNDDGAGVAVDSMGNIWQAGTTSGTFTENGLSHQAVSNGDTIIVKWNQQGVAQSVIGLSSGASEVNIPEDIIVTANDDVVVSGVFLGSLNAGNQKTLSDKGSGDAYIVKISKTGTTAWATSAGSNSATERAYSIAETSSGDFIVGGLISTSTDFGIHVATSNGGLDIYMAMLDSNGDWDWVETLGGSSDELFGGVAVNISDIPAAFGSFQASINKGTQSVASSGGLDLVVWSLDPVNNADKDNDGVNDLVDNCPNKNNPLQIDSDLDGDGDECDYDDDNDGITDNSGDDCPRGGAWNWTSDSTTDFDNDGCKDSSEDNDDDNDGVEDQDDSCLSSYSPPRNWWTSDSSNDLDGDGCRDADEDSDDDGDGFDDSSDDCNKVAGTSTLGTYTGCVDSDNDGWADIEDSCPQEAGNSTMSGLLACPDTDGDGWADSIDDLPEDSTQWIDQDGDGYGDNQDGNNPDSCVSTSGTSVLDRYGCPDPDMDGYSSADTTWTVEDGADAFPSDNTQWSDWDEDGFGDNYGNLSWTDRSVNWPGEYYQYARDQDACPTLSGNSWQDDILGCPDGDGDGWADFMDAFPADANEYLDSDKDGIADGLDACPEVSGNSTEDVIGCPDFDGDGWADPEIGSDWKPLDSTQWSDSDGDGYGDNPLGTSPDHCPQETGDSFKGDILGCIDTDNDGWADIIDSFPDERTQWNDTDGDGFGDNPNGNDADECPDVVGIAEENGCEKVVEESSGSILKYGGISVGIILALIVAGLLVMKLRQEDGAEKDWNDGVVMPDMMAQPSIPNMYAQPEMPNMNAQPSYTQYQQPAVPNMSAQSTAYSPTTPSSLSYISSNSQVQQAASPNLSALPGNQSVTPQSIAAPSGPTMYDVGTIRSDGNEWLEYPVASGAWYMRDGTTRQWIRKI